MVADNTRGKNGAKFKALFGRKGRKIVRKHKKHQKVTGNLGKIQEIKKIEDMPYDVETNSSLFDGYLVITDKHTFAVLIDNHQQSCENWGYMHSEDDLEKFIGADLYEIKLTDIARNVHKLKEICPYVKADQIQFVDFKTTKGTFQLVAYNEQNGFYGHKIIVLQDQVAFREGEI